MLEESPEKPHYLGHRQRLRERFLKAPESLPDYELLEMLLFMAKPRGDVKPLAKYLLERFGSFAAVISADIERLTAIDGLGEAAASSLKVVQAAALRLAREEIMGKSVLSSWDAVVGYCRASMAYLEVEQFRILFLDRKNQLIADEVQQRGTVDQTPVYPREVIKRALDIGASALIMVHNHPTGDTTPSKADIEMTKMVKEAGRGLGITVHDHVIVSKGKCTSFRSLGIL